ncbi:MAG: lysine decarboxylase, partial [Conexibacter sp.]|nr:lysine decarboxylase [Conexibacter sp.]
RSRVEALPGLHVLDDELLGAEDSHDLDRLQVLISVADLGISGYQAADWLRANCHLDVGLSDHQRVLATLSMADDEQTTGRLLAALEELGRAAPSLPRPKPVHVPSPTELELESVDTPRDAFLGPAEMVPVQDAVERIAAEQITPYPPGIPVLVPGERINAEVLEYLRTGLAAGMVLPDPADPSLHTIRVTAHASARP